MRLVVRRCSLNLLEVQENHVHVQFWGEQGLADLKPFFKIHGLARPGISVEVCDRKREKTTRRTGDDFLYGQPIAEGFPIERFVSKWNDRFQQESDDRLAAPMTNSGYAWDGLEAGRVPWTALKSAWQQFPSTPCLNCTGGTILVNFGYRQVGLFNRSPNFISICPSCRRSFTDNSITDVSGWMAANLKKEFFPVGKVIWGKRVAI